MKRFLPFLLAAALFGTALANDSKPQEDCCKAQAACCQPTQACCDSDKQAQAPVAPVAPVKTAKVEEPKAEAKADCCAEQQECCVEGADCCPAG